jgi:hypothetical protein
MSESMNVVEIIRVNNVQVAIVELITPLGKFYANMRLHRSKEVAKQFAKDKLSKENTYDR